jgi:transcriptional regulator with GAF, ATPase, and Fis domain
VRARIASTSCSPEAWDGQSACGPGLVVFDAVSASLLELVRGKALDDRRVIAVLTGEGPLKREHVFELLSAGAGDVIHWDDTPAAAARIVARLQRWADVEAALERAGAQRQLIGQSREWIRFLHQLSEAAVFSTAPILLLGESGTGKEQLARLVHSLNPRAGSCVVVDCSAVEASLSGSEFFGHEKGSFTGATGQREGAFLLAHQGTLFLDEVGELPAALQAQLLRVSQEKTYKRLGSNHWFESDFRLVSATHRDLTQEVKENRFRFDFLQRIGTWTFRVPPLRERPADILPLARHFAEQAMGKRFAGISPFLADDLMGRSYPGNVRELEQLTLRLCCRHVGESPLCVSDLPRSDMSELAAARHPARETVEQSSGRAVLAGLGLREVLRQARGAAIHAALDANKHNVRDAARLLGITDRALQMELAKREA